jgi:outer membrane receptor protein involved in Fe transport
MVNVPLSGTTAVRATGFYRRDPGYIDDPFRGDKNVNDGKTYGGRASLLSKITPNLSVRLTAAIEDLKSDSTPEEDVSISTLRPINGDLTQARAIEPLSDLRYRIYSGTVQWALPWATLLSNTSYGTLRQIRSQDFTALYDPVLKASTVSADSRITTNRFTQELRLTSAQGGSLEWQVGGYYTNERSHFVEAVDVVGGPLAPNYETVVIPSVYREFAGFADATYHFDRTFQLTLGGRYSHNNQRSIEMLTMQGVTNANPEERTSDNVFTFSIAPEAHIGTYLTVYGRVAKGYRPGGSNLEPPGNPAQPSFGPDTVINYEAGIKTELLDHHANLEASAFWIDWRNIQIQEEVAGFNINQNAGRARSRGFEISGDLRPLDGLSLSANAAYTDATLREASPLQGATVGDPLPYAPKWSAAIAADYEHPVTASIVGFVGASWRYLGRRSSDFNLSIGQLRLPAYETVDLRLGARAGLWSIEAFARNIADKRGITSISNPGLVPALGPTLGSGVAAGMIQPRSIGLTLGFTY